MPTRRLLASARTTKGSEYTAVELQLGFLEAAKRFVDTGGCHGIVPRADEIVDLWEDTLRKLRQCDFDSLSRRLDWVLKRNMLERVMSQRSLTWTSPELKHLDQLFASLDPAEGLFWAFERAGAVDRIVDDQLIRRHSTTHRTIPARGLGHSCFAFVRMPAKKWTGT